MPDKKLQLSQSGDQPRQPHAHEHAETAHAHASADAAHHHPFNIQSALLHHNMPYPAWEPLHGKPFIVFDRALYAAFNYGSLSHHPAFLTTQADPADVAWAEELLERPEGMSSSDFRFDSTQLEAVGVAKAMQIADSQAGIVFPKALSFFNQQIFFGTIALILFTLVISFWKRRRPEQLRPEGRLQHFFESVVIYLRDEVVRPSIHHGADRWLPFIATVFFVVLTVNLFGLIPGTGTMSGNIGVTAAFSVCILFCMLFFGIKEQGLKYWTNLVPVHFSWAMSPIWLLLLVIEVLGLIIKPAALAIRLFANMFAGHTVLLVFFSLGYIIFTADPASSGLATGLKGFGWLLGMVFHAMEVLVAFIQAYVFTLLSALFIGMSIHPEH